MEANNLKLQKANRLRKLSCNNCEHWEGLRSKMCKIQKERRQANCYCAYFRISIKSYTALQKIRFNPLELSPRSNKFKIIYPDSIKCHCIYHNGISKAYVICTVVDNHDGFIHTIYRTPDIDFGIFTVHEVSQSYFEYMVDSAKEFLDTGKPLPPRELPF